MIHDEINSSNNYFYDLSIWKYPYKNHVINRVDDIDITDWMEFDSIQRVFINSTLSIDFCIVGTEFLKDAKSCLVCFSGAVAGDRTNKPAPILSGLKTSSNLKMPLISISDPTMALSKNINIGWYAGNKEIPNLISIIAKILDKIFYYNLRKQILFGGSGGGFASLAVAQFMEVPVSVCVVNPQTQIGKYVAEHVRKYLLTAYNIDPQKFNYDLSSQEDIDFALNQYVIHHDLNNGKFNKKTKIIYLQNLSDTHTKIHAVPFFKKYFMKNIGESIFISSSQTTSIGLYIGNWGDGHAPITESLLNETLRLLDDDKDIYEILEFLDKRDNVELPIDLLSDISHKIVNIDNFDTPSEFNICLDEKYIFYRNNSSNISNFSIELTIASNHNVGKFELLYTVDYLGKVGEDYLLKMNYVKSPILSIGFYKYIGIISNSVYKREIIIEFPIGVDFIYFELKSFYPKGKTSILDVKIKSFS